jgi:hypothetical protein
VTSPKRWLSGGYFITATGRELRALNPRPEDIDIRDIAHHLALVNRFGGATPYPYSVAHHSLAVADLLEPYGLGKEGLLHDAAEAYLGDMIKAVKVHLPDYRAIEGLWNDAIEERFNLIDSALIKEADVAVLLAERRCIFRDTTRYLDDEAATTLPIPTSISACSWDVARARFLERAERYNIR